MTLIAEIQLLTFRVEIRGKIFTWKKLSLYRDNEFIPITPKVKGSTYGWNVCGIFVSYYQLKELCTTQEKDCS